ncbi:hypothetical protein C0992_009654 [Termitomyces sp. T32_za158]|nr:hypothetical protein C0992_009654 [Termitomyces sp. T32_za158]
MSIPLPSAGDWLGHRLLRPLFFLLAVWSPEFNHSLSFRVSLLYATLVQMADSRARIVRGRSVIDRHLLASPAWTWTCHLFSLYFEEVSTTVELILPDSFWLWYLPPSVRMVRERYEVRLIFYRSFSLLIPLFLLRLRL